MPNTPNIESCAKTGPDGSSSDSVERFYTPVASTWEFEFRSINVAPFVYMYILFDIPPHRSHPHPSDFQHSCMRMAHIFHLHNWLINKLNKRTATSVAKSDKAKNQRVVVDVIEHDSNCTLIGKHVVRHLDISMVFAAPRLLQARSTTGADSKTCDSKTCSAHKDLRPKDLQGRP